MTVLSPPSVPTATTSGHRIARGAILTIARLCTSGSVASGRTRVRARAPSESGRARAGARHGVAACVVFARARLTALGAEGTVLATWK